MRCLFYWLAKGHSTVLCFPATFNPIISRQFNASEEEKQNLQQLTHYKMLMLFQAEHSKQWYQSLLDNHRACLITTVSQWRMQMPNNLYTGVFSADGERDLGRKYVPKRMEECPERLLQPFFSQKGQLVFFSSFSSTGQSLATIILDQSAVNSQQDFDRLNNLQLSFITQCKNLKLLFDLMHDKAGVKTNDSGRPLL
uniref:Uncharacterized protein n=1 Tax=Ditylenchus dipsaci TaxID=166011 RepID=A0A915ENW0_9BILA